MAESIQVSKKVVMLGDPAVGKTSMIQKFVHDIFDDKYISTLGTKVSSKIIVTQHPRKDASIEMKFMIWDVMGQKDYEMFHHSAYSGSQGALIVCDITRRQTFENLPEWVSNLFSVTNQIPIVLIGNKVDLANQKEFEYEDLLKLASTFDSASFLTSAKTGENIEQAFSILAQDIIKTDHKY